MNEESDEYLQVRPGHARAKLRASQDGSASRFTNLFSLCANPSCHSGWLHLWRSRSAPIFEGAWSCSALCTQALVEQAVRRELEGRREEGVSHRHRIPLGLVMLGQGWINTEQLRSALEAQKASGHGRLGHWLVQQRVPERLVTRALSLQWSCPVLPVDGHDAERMSSALPRLFVDAFAALPLKVAAARILYLGFEERLDPALTLSMERMLGLRVESGLVRGSLFHLAHERLLTATYPSTEMIEAASESSLARTLSRVIERVRPLESRLVRVHDCLWLRLWERPQAGPLPERHAVQDLICSLRSN